MKRHKGIIIILLVLVLARIPIPGKTGQAASLISRAVRAGYEKTICSTSHSVLEQAARQVALGISCPNDKYQFSLAVLHNMLQPGSSSDQQQEPAKPKSHRSRDQKASAVEPNQSSVAGKVRD
jgi:hypothetical protein